MDRGLSWDLQKKSNLALSKVLVLGGDRRASCAGASRDFGMRPLPSHPLPIGEREEEFFFTRSRSLRGFVPLGEDLLLLAVRYL